MPFEHTSPDDDLPLQRFDTPSHDYFADVQTIGSQDKDSDAASNVHTLSSASELSDYTSYFDDPNLDPTRTADFDDDSPYPEVRSAVANTDDPTIPVLTLRTWVLGVALSVLISGVNQFLFFRYPSVPIVSVAAQLISYPLGMLWALYMPRKQLFGVSLNPGPFSIKEHVLITIMAGVGSQSAYATDIIAVQRVYYNQRYGFSYQWFLVVSTQLIGFSAGGIARRFLVTPPSMIWPSTLVTCALFNTLHSQQYAGTGRLGGMSRERFFLYAFTASYLWYFFPGYLFQGLSYFSWVTWIWPENAGKSGYLGYRLCDSAWLGSYCAAVWAWLGWAAANILFGFIVFYSYSSLYGQFTNTWHSLYMPIQARGVFDNTLHPYNVTRILTPETTLDVEPFNHIAHYTYRRALLCHMDYRLLRSQVTCPHFLQGITMKFQMLATLVHTFLHFRKQIIHQSRRSLREEPDIHARLMSLYPQVPDWWYLVLFLAMFVLGVISIELWHTQMPVWAFVIALLIAFSYVIPCGMIQAITNQQVGLNVVTELVIGYALPGRPIATMLFKTFGYITMTQALTFTADFKLGHYMKIPPRIMFWCQIICTIIAGTTQLLVQAWMFDHVPDMCSDSQKDGFVCPSTQVFATASIIWGVVGPKLQFSAGHLYRSLLYFFVIGAIAPLIPWLLMKKWPNSFLRYINFPVIFNGTNLIPPATALNFIPWALVGFIFQFFVRRRYFAWWAKYNYVLSAALDAGLALSVITIFFALQYPLDGTIGANTVQNWWGNRVFQTNYDGRGIPVRQLAEGETFG
ncbi:OPT oligopeptide transporter protein-domain-containing protein [Chiua virens]|nr:OPT oligopeptide transporter protein-domain-containing protein [Chiua virens]